MKLLTYLQQKMGFARRKSIDVISHRCITINGLVCLDAVTDLQDGDEIKITLPGYTPHITTFVTEIPTVGLQQLLLFNKPKGYVVSLDDPHNRTIYELLPPMYRQGWYYIGRLDKDSRGLVALTSDPAMVDAYEHPSHEVSKKYIVRINKPLDRDDADAMRKGVLVDEQGNNITEEKRQGEKEGRNNKGLQFLAHTERTGQTPSRRVTLGTELRKQKIDPRDREGGRIQEAFETERYGNIKRKREREGKYRNVQTNESDDSASIVDMLKVQSVHYECKKKQHRLQITLTAGKKRHIRRLLRALGYTVVDLVRVAIGPYILGDIKPTKFRLVKKIEIAVNGAKNGRVRS